MTSDGTISICVNGEHRRVDPGLTLAVLASEVLGLDATKVAVERNLEVVARSTLHKVLVKDGDELEIVHFVGGGSAFSVRAYQCNLDGPLVDLGIASMVDARRLLDERFPFADMVFEEAENAVQKTMFGFHRSDDDYLEIHLIASDHITLRHEVQEKGFFAKLRGSRAYEVVATSRGEVEKLVEAYFESTEALEGLFRIHPSLKKG